MDLLAKAKKLPLTPGVYEFINAKREILYIGRATSLRRRVLQYFQKRLEPRLAEMVGLAVKLKTIDTETVLEAIILEANLIKKHWPKYNIKDKDDRSFNYVVFAQGDYPRPIIIRGRELSRFPRGSAKIFGPFQNAALLKNTLRVIRRIFPYSTCKPNSGQPCFDYQIGLCPGTCVGRITPAEYRRNVANIIKIFEGKKKQLIKALEKTNPESAIGLKHISDAALITKDELVGTGNIGRIEAYDISHFAGQEAVGALAVFINGEPDKSAYRLFNIHTPAGDDLRALEEMITRRLNHQDWPLPDVFVIDGGRPQIDFLKKMFAKRRLAKPLVGLSKLAGDKLVYPAGAGRDFKILAENAKPIFLRARDEAHRFGNSARKRKLANRFKKG
ncbi:MAG: GIY-YIG nuclease family protein [Patescibacteria group bacterium]